MAKQTGLGDRLYVAEYDLSGDIGSIENVSGGMEPLDMTDISQEGMARAGGLRSGRVEFGAYFDPDTDQAHPVLSALPTTDVLVSYLRGAGLGSEAACMVGKQLNYDGTRATDGSFLFSVSAESNGYGLQWGHQLTAGTRTDTAATDGTGVDSGAASSFGLQAFLHVLDFTGTDATVKLQQSSDNGAGDAWADVTDGGFTTVTGPGWERIATADDQAVERYLRVVTTGTFSDLDFLVVVVPNVTEVAF